MEVMEAIELRRAYRSLEPVTITKNLIKDLAKSAGLSPSCFNYQPWRLIFVKDRDILTEDFKVKFELLRPVHYVGKRTNKFLEVGKMFSVSFVSPKRK